MKRHKIVVVEDERLLGKSIQRFLSEKFECILFSTAEEAQEWIKTNSVDVIISDIRLPKKSGMDLLKWVRNEAISTPFIIITAQSSIKNAVEAIKNGAQDYICKPLDLEDLELAINQSLELQELKEEVVYHRKKQEPLQNSYLEGDSEAERVMKRLVEIERNTGEAPTVLITGETGTGKGIISRRLHGLSPRAAGPFIELNCTAITETMFESELFGHEKGAFTGATGKKIGLLELAHGGTLFLDEIGHAPLSFQAKLLKVIENKTFRRVGGTKEIWVNIRLLTATNLELSEAIRKHLFREDLFHRLNLLNIHIPALKSRPEDIRPYALFFLEQAKRKYKTFDLTLTEKNINDLERYSWPGNLRELNNEIERSVLLYNGKELDFKHLIHVGVPEKKIAHSISLNSQSFFVLPPEGLDIGQFEKKVIEQALIQKDKNITAAAELLNCSRDILRYRIKKHKINLQELSGWIQPIPEEGLDLELLEKNIVDQAMKISERSVTAASKLLHLTRDMLRYRLK